MDGPLLSLDEARQRTDMIDLQRVTGCSGNSCDVLLAEFTYHPLWHCSGLSVVGDGGDFKGHLLPGCLFLIWATHWLVNTMRGYFIARSQHRIWESRCCQPVLWFSDRWPVEGVLKATLPWIGIVLELWLGHESYRRLSCEDSRLRGGHFYGDHLQNWSHACMYLGIVISGVADVVASVVKLPKGTSHIYLGLAFFAEALLMGLHKKHTAIDALVHVLLTSAMLTNSMFCFFEVAWPHTFLLSCGRIAATYLQAFWFIGAGHILFRGLAAWDTSGGDLAPAMYAPLVFMIHIFSILCIMLASYLIGYIALNHRGNVNKR